MRTKTVKRRIKQLREAKRLAYIEKASRKEYAIAERTLMKMPEDVRSRVAGHLDHIMSHIESVYAHFEEWGVPCEHMYIGADSMLHFRRYSYKRVPKGLIVPKELRPVKVRRPKKKDE